MPPPAVLTRLQPLGFTAGGRQLLVSAAFDRGQGQDESFCASFTIDPLATGDPAPPVAAAAPATGCPAPPPLSQRDATGRSWQIDGNDIVILPGAGGGAPLRLASPRQRYDSGSVSPDAQFVAQVAVSGSGDSVETRVVARSLRSGTVFPEARFRGGYGRVQWLDDGRLLLIPWPEADDFCVGTVPETLIVDAATGAIVDHAATLRQLNPLGSDGTLVAIGPAACPSPGTRAADIVMIRRPPKVDQRWKMRDGTGVWLPLDLPTLAGREIARLTARPDGSGIALMTAAPRRTRDLPYSGWRILLAGLDARQQPVRTGLLPDRFDDPDNDLEQGNLWGFGIGRDGKVLVVGVENHVFCFETATGKAIFHTGDLEYGFDSPSFYSADRAALMIGGARLSKFVLYDLGNGKPAYIDARGLQSAGVLPGRNLLWSLSRDGTARFYDRRSRARILTSFRLPDGGYFTLDTTNRYDTNQGADSATVRWRLTDRPWETLPPQMFMRDRYEPDLLPRRLDCTMAGTCDQVFRPLPLVASLNRALPQVRIVAARPGPTPTTARVDVEARIIDVGGATSGLHDLRLLRDNRLVAQWPLPRERGDGSDDDRDRLRPDAQGIVRHSFVVPLPVTRANAPVAFTAYGFNADHRKGETSDPVRLAPPFLATRQRRAFVLTIGIDRYAIPGRTLDFAAADARALAGALARIDGYPKVYPLTLVADGTVNHATRALIRAAFALLAGMPGDWAKQLQRAGVETNGFGAATPDDIVVISWSGHGIADATGHFALLPSDARQADAFTPPDPASLVSADDLAAWLRPLDAGETALIIDACHSAASVTAGGFKPGPMGDAGLGQLAFDKGIRVLAATQADDVALESREQGLGLLTATLINEGLGGKAPGTSDGWVRLDAVLRHAAARLPQLMAEQAARAEQAADATWPPLLVAASPQPPRPQVPAVFDFTGRSSPAWVSAVPQ
ncbi:hypothetical protein IP88_02020 [alpha proteobacterium AAP81b]|nr:hypothetical protein IP88_02020 [alpha proteobacterium AAP81b]